MRIPHPVHNLQIIWHFTRTMIWLIWLYYVMIICCLFDDDCNYLTYSMKYCVKWTTHPNVEQRVKISNNSQWKSVERVQQLGGVILMWFYDDLNMPATKQRSRRDQINFMPSLACFRNCLAFIFYCQLAGRMRNLTEEALSLHHHAEESFRE